MKKVLFGAVLALGMVACGETAPVEEVSTVNTEAVLEMEATTNAVAEGTEVLDAEVEELAEEMGDLLNAL
jgi:hypothetical protein